MSVGAITCQLGPRHSLVRVPFGEVKVFPGIYSALIMRGISWTWQVSACVLFFFIWCPLGIIGAFSRRMSIVRDIVGSLPGAKHKTALSVAYEAAADQ